MTKKRVTYWTLTLITGIVVTVSSHYIIKVTSKTPNNENITGVKQKEVINYLGSVGKWKAQFNLTFDYQNKSVIGSYSYPKRPNIIYKVKGSFDNNSLTLIEYTGNRISAECFLTRTEEKCFEGIMKNTDGRNLSMSLCEY